MYQLVIALVAGFNVLSYFSYYNKQKLASLNYYFQLGLAV